MGVDGLDRLGNTYCNNSSLFSDDMDSENVIPTKNLKEASVCDRNLSEKLEIIENYITNLSENVKQASENNKNSQVLNQLSVLESQIKELKNDKESLESQNRIDGMENILKEIVGKLNQNEKNYLKEYVDWRENNIMVI
jgi:hypothetical protein